MEQTKKNRYIIYMFCTAIIMMFLFSYHPNNRLNEKYPFFNIFNPGGSGNILLYILLGYTMVHSFYYLESEKIIARTIKVLGIYFVTTQIYEFIFRDNNISVKYAVVYLMMILAGILVGYISTKNRKGMIPEKMALQKKNGWNFISTYRNELMGVAMIYVLLFHTNNLGAEWGKGIWAFFTESGYFGVDIFIFLSGVGMVFSLSKNPPLSQFYKKRILRIFPDYIIVVGIYTLVCIGAGKCGWDMLVTNCTTLSFWLGGSCAFNWYVPGIVVFYLLTPFIFKFLKNRKIRYQATAVMCAGVVLILNFLPDFYQIDRWNIAFARLPVYLFGIIVGLNIKENKQITRQERNMQRIVALIAIGIYILREHLRIPVYGWHWILFAAVVPCICLELSDIFEKCNKENTILLVCRWCGENSLLIFLINVVMVRFNNMFVRRYIVGYTKKYLLYCMLLTGVNLLIVYVIAGCRKKIKTKII